ncbi:metallopeptidase TldD-related protein [Streptomyces sp. NPDC005760]|uniref:metallopeptidase TldD-related protein n=1 Tax=Streptomyces sp. NPDC005760 TaxID=3156718 RepID=UPI0033E4A36A
MNTPLPAEEIVERALALSRAAHCDVIVDDTDAAWLRWAGDEVTANGASGVRRVTVISTGAGGGAAVSGTVDDPHDLEGLVRASEAPNDAPAAGAAAAPEPIRGDGAFESAELPEAAPAREQLSALVPEFVRAQRRSQGVLHGFAQHRTGTAWLGTSAGIRSRHRLGTSTLDLYARTPDGSRTAWAGAVADGFHGMDLPGLEAATTGRVQQPLPYRELPPGRYEVLLSPAAVADLMTAVYRAGGAADASEGRTVFARPGGSTRIGDTLAALPLNLRSDPREPGLECRPFLLSHGAVSDAFGDAVQAGADPADNGMPLPATYWMKDGVLTSLLASRADAARLGLPVRPAVGNLVLDGGTDRSLTEMIRTTRRALVINCLWYIRPTDAGTLTLTGLTRDGVHLVEDGHITAYVNDFRFAESPVSLLSRAVEAGRTERAPAREAGMTFPRTAMPPLRIPDFRFTTKAPSVDDGR